jgi:O-antigen/teichoic acid export membrane protein
MRRVLSREALTVLAFSGAQLLLGLASTRLLTQIANPDALGEYYLYMNLSAWLTLPTSSSFLYLWKNWTRARANGQGHRLAQAVMRGLSWQSALCVTGCIAFALTGLVRASWLVIVPLTIVSVGQAINIGLDPIQMLERRRVVAGVLGLLATPVRWAALALGVIVLAHASGASLMWTQCVYGTATAALSVWFFRRTVDSPYEGEKTANDHALAGDLGARRFLSFTAPILVMGIATQAATSGERWGLALRADAGATALFVQTLAVSLAAVGAVATPINTYFAPIIAQAAATSPGDPLRGAARPLRQFILVSTLTISLIALGVSLVAGPLTTVLFGPRYRDIGALLPWAMLGQAFFGISQAIALVPISVEGTTAVSVALVGSRMIYLVLLLVLPTSGAIALLFVKCFAAGNLLYLLGMIIAAVRAMRMRRTPVADALA